MRGAFAFGHFRMCLDELDVVINSDQAAVSPYGYGFSEIRIGHRVEGVPEADVMVGMHLGFRPDRHVEPVSRQRFQMLLFFFQKRLQGSFPGRAVDAEACHVPAPFVGLFLRMVAVRERFALEKVLPDIRNLTFHRGLCFRMTDRSRIDDKTAVFGVLKEDLIEDRLIPVRFHHGGLHVIEDDAPRHAAERVPCRLDPLNQGINGLPVGREHVLMAAHDERDHECV